MKKRLLSLVLVICLLLPTAILPTSATAEEAYTLTYNGTSVEVPANTTAPASTVIDGKTVVAWQYDGKTVAVGESMTLTKDTTLTPVTITAPQTQETVSFKLAEYVNGDTPSDLALRFTAKLSKADYATLYSLGEVKIGMLITPLSYVFHAGDFTKEALNTLNTKNGSYVHVVMDGCYEMTDTDYIFAASLKNFSNTTLEKNPEFTAILYATVTTKSGHEFTVYGGLDVLCAHGVKEVATSLSSAESTLTNQQKTWLSRLKSTFEAFGAPDNDKGIFLNVDINTVTFPFLQTVVADGVVTEEELRPFVDQYKNTQITDLAFDVFCQSSMTPSDVWTDVIDIYNRKLENGVAVDYTALMNHYYQLYEVHKIDPHAVWFDACRDAGITSWLTVRMNDCHNPDDETVWIRGDEHYEAKENSWMIGSAYGHQKICYDYSVKEIRNRMKAYIREQLFRYDTDGLELDFSREWYCFDYLNETNHTAIMTQFIRDVNGIVEEAEAKWGHDIKIKIKLMRDIEQNLTFGFDARAYDAEGLCDIIGVAPRWASNDNDMPIREWKAAFPNVEIHATITDLTWVKATSYEVAAGYAAAYLAQGSDKINLYNYFSNPNSVPDKHKKLYNTAGSLKTLSGVVRRNVVAYQDVTPAGHTQYKPLPATANGFSLDLLTGPIKRDELVYLVVGVNNTLKAGDLSVTANGHELAFYGKTEYSTFYAGSLYQYCYLLPAHLAKQAVQSFAFSTDNASLTIGHMELIFGERSVPLELNLPADEIVKKDDRWKLLHRFDFTTDVSDSVGGVTVTPVATHANTPTFKNGRIVLDGNTVYTLDTPIEFSASDDFRVTVKGKFDTSVAPGGVKRIFGSAQGVSSGICYININTAQYGNGYALSFSPKTNAWNSYVLFPDKEKHDINEEHVLDFLYYGKMLYVYMDGELMCARASANADDFIFTDFLGCSFITSGILYNAVGEIDYIAVSELSDTPLSEVLPFDTDQDAAPLPETPDEAVATNNWELLHRWSFNGDVSDDVGGVTVTPVATHAKTPTFENGHIILDGNTVYTIDTPIELSANDNFKVVIKGRFDMSASTGLGAKRVFGSANGVNSGICYINMTGDQYKGYSVSFSPKTTNWNSYVLFPDKEKHDMTSAEHVLEFMQFKGFLYIYMDGELMCSRAAKNTDSFYFTDFLGCSFISSGITYNAVGEIDFIAIAKLSDYVVEEPLVWDVDRDRVPAPTSAEEARASENYEILHRFDFTTDVSDSVGGLSLTLDDVHNTVPTLVGGRAVLDGHTAYTLSSPIKLSAKDNFKVVVKGRFDMSAATGYGVKRIFGSAQGINSGICYINLAGDSYKGYSVSFSPITTAWNSYVLFPDKTKHDMTNAEHVLEFMQFEGFLYVYMDGELMCSRAAKNGDDFSFTDFLGCSFDNSTAYNAVGSIDYVAVARLSEYAVTAAPVWDVDEDEPTKPETAEQAILSTLWQNVNAWEFDGDLTDSVGGVTATLSTRHATAPTFENGKIVLDGHTAYLLDTPITFSAADNFKVSVKGCFDMSAATGYGVKRIFGSASGVNSGICYINLAGDSYKGYSVSFSPKTTNWNSYVLFPDKEKHDITSGEHLLEFMQFEGFLYVYMDGELMCSRAAENTDDFCFTEFLGCSYDSSISYNAVGTIDYIRISTFPD